MSRLEHEGVIIIPGELTDGKARAFRVHVTSVNPADCDSGDVHVECVTVGPALNSLEAGCALERVFRESGGFTMKTWWESDEAYAPASKEDEE